VITPDVELQDIETEEEGEIHDWIAGFWEGLIMDLDVIIDGMFAISTGVNVAINGAVWFKLGTISNRVSQCENFQVSPKN
jgi:hypothetical protein